MSTTYIAGVGMTVFGRQDDRTISDLAAQAILAALDDAQIDPGRIGAFYSANVFGGMVVGQIALRDLGFGGPPIYNVENACASGATAVHLAMHALAAGVYDTVLCFGVEKLSSLLGRMIPLQDADEKTALFVSEGLSMPAVYAMRANRYLFERQLGVDVLARVAVKNRRNGALNPFAQQRTPVTLDEVLGSRPIAEPLTLLQCCPAIADGAAALVLTSKRPSGPGVSIVGSSVSSGHQEDGQDDILSAEITRRSAIGAYEMAGLGPEDLDVVECHDAFTIGELLYYEALGLCPAGESDRLIVDGATELGGAIPVNPSGGLLAKGHPVGATGVAQMVELAWQLRGSAGDRQVPGARIGLAQCTGGGIAGVDHAASAVHVLAAVG